MGKRSRKSEKLDRAAIRHAHLREQIDAEFEVLKDAEKRGRDTTQDWQRLFNKADRDPEFDAEFAEKLLIAWQEIITKYRKVKARAALSEKLEDEKNDKNDSGIQPD